MRRKPISLALFVLISLSLRASVVAVSPLLDQIVDDTGMTEGQAGLLITLPLICFGLFSPFAPALVRRFGMDSLLVAAMVVLAGGLLIRLFDPIWLLLAGTVILGLGTTVANVIMPALIKRDFARRLGTITGIYTVSIGIGAAIGAAIPIPIQEITGWGWREVLALWAIPALATALVLLRRARRARRDRAAGARAPAALPVSGFAIYRDPLAWSVSIVFGTQALVYFAAIAWMPAILTDAGVDAGRAGLMLALFNLAGMPLTFLVPIWAARRSSQFALLTVTCGLNAVGVLGLMFAPATLTLVWVLVFACGQASAFGLAFTLVGVRSPDERYATDLSGMAQAVGYCLAGIGPVLVGIVYEIAGDWTLAFGLLLVVIAVLQASGFRAARPAAVRVNQAGASRRARRLGRPDARWRD